MAATVNRPADEWPEQGSSGFIESCPASLLATALLIGGGLYGIAILIYYTVRTILLLIPLTPLAIVGALIVIGSFCRNPLECCSRIRTFYKILVRRPHSSAPSR